jgi:hypothetical protein
MEDNKCKQKVLIIMFIIIISHLLIRHKCKYGTFNILDKKYENFNNTSINNFNNNTEKR